MGWLISMARIKGITVTLINKKEIGKDPFKSPIYEDVEVVVDNVLVSPTSVTMWLIALL